MAISKVAYTLFTVQSLKSLLLTKQINRSRKVPKGAFENDAFD